MSLSVRTRAAALYASHVANGSMRDSHCLLMLLIWLGERDLRAVGIAGVLVAFAVTVAVSWISDRVRYRRVGRP